jgi:hypothetical protein
VHRLLAGALVLDDRPDEALAEFAAALRLDLATPARTSASGRST